MLRALVVIALVLPAVSASGVPMNVGHRGFSAATPENTLTAERRAFDVGADMVELDLQKSSDGYVVVIHDDTVGRTTDSLTDDRVDSLTLSELRALDAGYPARFGSEFAGEQIPTLEEILEEAKGRGPLLLDQKSSLLFGSEIAAALASTAFPLDQVWTTAWNEAQVADIQLHVPSARILWTQGAPSIWEATMDDFLDQMEALGVDGISVVFENYTFSAPGLAAATQARGLLAFAWNFEAVPDTPEKMQTAIEIGLDGYIVNDPETFASIIPLPDTDGDGVLDEEDACLGTVLPDAAPELKKNRYSVTDAGVFVSEGKNAPTFTIWETGGCSASQIVDLAGLGVGHRRFGLSRSALEGWIADLGA